MIGRAGFSSKCWRVLRWAGLAAAAPALWACTSRTLEMPNITPTATLTTNFTQKINNEIDIVHDRQLVVDDGDAEEALRPAATVHERAHQPATPPSLHVAVVSSDMGAPGDSTTSIMCTKAGDQGQFQSMPRGTCTATTINRGDTFISDADSRRTSRTRSTRCSSASRSSATRVAASRTSSPRSIALLAAMDSSRARTPTSCGPRPTSASSSSPTRMTARPRQHSALLVERRPAEHQQPARPHRQLPLQPVRSHLHQPQRTTHREPPKQPPADATMTGSTPTLNLTNCISDDTGGLLTPVSQFVSDIKALKPTIRTTRSSWPPSLRRRRPTRWPACRSRAVRTLSRARSGRSSSIRVAPGWR